MKFNELTQEQQNNLITLRDGLKELYGDTKYHDRFSMKWYARRLVSKYNFRTRVSMPHILSKIPLKRTTECCVIGHGPLLGIEALHNESWLSYRERAFGCNSDALTVGNYLMQFYLFSCRHSNNIQNAIERLTSFINGFDPENEYWDFS